MPIKPRAEVYRNDNPRRVVDESAGKTIVEIEEWHISSIHGILTKTRRCRRNRFTWSMT